MVFAVAKTFNALLVWVVIYSEFVAQICPKRTNRLSACCLAAANRWRFRSLGALYGALVRKVNISKPHRVVKVPDITREPCVLLDERTAAVTAKIDLGELAGPDDGSCAFGLSRGESNNQTHSNTPTFGGYLDTLGVEYHPNVDAGSRPPTFDPKITDKAAQIQDFIYHVKGELLKQYYSPLHESYKKSTLCGTEMIVTKADGVTKMRHLYLCRCKWCLRCQRIRSAELINAYSPLIATWDDLYMVSLTVKNVNPLELKNKLSEMQTRFRNIMRTIHRRMGRSDIKAIKTIEVTVNPNTRELHPHYHILTENAEVAYMMEKLWMIRSTKEGDKVVSDGQDVVRASSPTEAAVEMFKYVTKFLGESKGDGKKSFDGWLLDKIYVGTYRKHLIQTFGFEKPKVDSDSEEEELVPTDEADPIGQAVAWVPAINQYVNKATGEVISNYKRSKEFLRILAIIKGEFLDSG